MVDSLSYEIFRAPLGGLLKLGVFQIRNRIFCPVIVEFDRTFA